MMKSNCIARQPGIAEYDIVAKRVKETDAKTVPPAKP